MHCAGTCASRGVDRQWHGLRGKEMQNGVPVLSYGGSSEKDWRIVLVALLCDRGHFSILQASSLFPVRRKSTPFDSRFTPIFGESVEAREFSFHPFLRHPLVLRCSRPVRALTRSSIRRAKPSVPIALPDPRFRTVWGLGSPFRGSY